MKITEAIRSSGYGLSGDIGGLKYQTYWTPSGEMKRAVANMRDYVVKNTKGEVIRSGTRDANLDKGWLLEKPTVLKIHCLFCDKWHDTQQEVDVCKIVAEVEKKKMEVVTNAEIEVYLKEQKESKDSKISQLETQIAKLTKLVESLLPKKERV